MKHKCQIFPVMKNPDLTSQHVLRSGVQCAGGGGQGQLGSWFVFLFYFRGARLFAFQLICRLPNMSLFRRPCFLDHRPSVRFLLPPSGKQGISGFWPETFRKFVGFFCIHHHPPQKVPLIDCVWKKGTAGIQNVLFLNVPISNPGTGLDWPWPCIGLALSIVSSFSCSSPTQGDPGRHGSQMTRPGAIVGVCHGNLWSHDCVYKFNILYFPFLWCFVYFFIPVSLLEVC